VRDTVLAEGQRDQAKGDAEPPKPPAATPRTGLRAWAVQVGSFRERDKATQLVARLRKAGFEAMEPDEVVIAGKTWFRVRVGPEVDRKRSERQLTEINRISGLKGLVVRYP
jgi:DedD protein